MQPSLWCGRSRSQNENSSRRMLCRRAALNVALWWGKSCAVGTVLLAVFFWMLRSTHSHCSKKLQLQGKPTPVSKQTLTGSKNPENNYTPPPNFWTEGIFRGGGGPGCTLKPPAAGIFYASPLLYTPPTPRKLFSGVGEWGRIRFDLVKKHPRTYG